MLQGFQDGAVENINGRTYRRVGGKWVPDQAAAPRPLISVPQDPMKVQSQGLDIAKGTLDLSRGTQDLTKGNLDIEGKKLANERERLALERDKLTQTQKEFGVDQGKAAGFYQRAVKANRYYDGLGIGAPSLGREAAEAILPEGLVNKFTGDKRQQAEAAQNDFIASTLRYESGAAIPPEEMDAQRRRYFPVAGDGPDTIKLKAQLRQNAIEALMSSAGGAAPNIAPPRVLTDEQATTELTERMRRGEKPAAIIKWLIDNNRTPDEETISRIMGMAGNANAYALPPEEPSPYMDALKVGVGDLVEGVGSVGGLIANPFTEIVNQVAGTNIRPDLGQNLRDMMGLPEGEGGLSNLASAINQTAAGGLGLSGLARGAAPILSGATQRGLSTFGSRPLTDAFAGAVGGGASEVTRQAGGGPVAQIAAGLGAGGIGALGANRVNSLMTTPRRSQSALEQAGRQEGVTVNRAMDDPAAEARLTGVGKTVVGSRLMQRDMGQVGDQIQSRLQSLGGGQVLDPNVAGQKVQQTATNYIKNSGQQFKRQYDALEKEVGGIKVPPAKAAQILDGVIADLSETAGLNSAEITFLKTLRDDFSKDLSVGALRRARTTLRKKVSKGDLTFGESEANVLGVMDAAADDIANGLAAAGKPGVARRFKNVDSAYRDRMEFIKGTVQKVVGPRNANLPPERIIANMKAMASPKGDSEGLGRMLKAMEPEDREDIVSTFVDALGKNKAGEFSTAILVNNLENLPNAARVQVFGEEGARSLENLSMLAKEHKRVSKALGGSPTGLANDYRSYLTNLVLGGGAALQSGSGTTGAAIAVAGYGLKAGRDAISSKLLMSKEFTGWLRAAPKTQDSKVINQHFGRLAVISSRNPSISAEVQHFARAVNENVAPTGQAVASPNEGPEQDR